MLVPIKYGIERTPIGIDEYLVKCPSCESEQWADVMVFSVYSHFWFIPLFPNDKDALVICKKCGLKRNGVPFDSNFISNFHEVKNRYRHKWFTYIGVTIIVSPFIIWITVLVNRFFIDLTELIIFPTVSDKIAKKKLQPTWANAQLGE